jgi:hypothetical protein
VVQREHGVGVVNCPALDAARAVRAKQGRRVGQENAVPARASSWVVSPAASAVPVALAASLDPDRDHILTELRDFPGAAPAAHDDAHSESPGAMRWWATRARSAAALAP